jgi:hypothetical protein
MNLEARKLKDFSDRLKEEAEQEFGHVEALDRDKNDPGVGITYFCRFRTLAEATRHWRRWIQSLRVFCGGRVYEAEPYRSPMEKIDPQFLTWIKDPDCREHEGFIFIRARVAVGIYESRKIVIDPATKNVVNVRDTGRPARSWRTV